MNDKGRGPREKEVKVLTEESKVLRQVSDAGVSPQGTGRVQGVRESRKLIVNRTRF